MWSKLTKTITASKSSKDKFGKIERKNPIDDTVDELQCVHFGVCSGCSIRGNFTTATPILARARKFFSNNDVTMRTHMQNCLDRVVWRTQVKLAVQPMSKWGGLKFGLLFKAGSHEVEAIPLCRVHHPAINMAVEELKKNALDGRRRARLLRGGGGRPQGHRGAAVHSDERRATHRQGIMWGVTVVRRTSSCNRLQHLAISCIL